MGSKIEFQHNLVEGPSTLVSEPLLRHILDTVKTMPSGHDELLQ